MMGVRKLKDDCEVYQADSLYRVLMSYQEMSRVDRTTENLYRKLMFHLSRIMPDYYVVDVRDPDRL